MEKAYDLKALGEIVAAEAKKEGLEIAEEAVEKLAKAVYFGVKMWAKESAALSSNIVDDFASKFYDYADPYVIPEIEKLDLDKDSD